MKNLKPVIFLDGTVNHYRENQYAQNLLLKALSDGITDPKELRKIAGLNSVAEVYRTLDKIQIRKEYHDALFRAGLSLDFVVDKLKSLCSDETSDKVKLGAVQTLLKSLGLDKYEKQEEAGKNWEEIILELTEKNKEVGNDLPKIDSGDYEVNAPLLPEAVKKRQKDEQEIANELYEG